MCRIKRAVKKNGHGKHGRGAKKAPKFRRSAKAFRQDKKKHHKRRMPRVIHFPGIGNPVSDADLEEISEALEMGAEYHRRARTGNGETTFEDAD